MAPHPRRSPRKHREAIPAELAKSDRFDVVRKLGEGGMGVVYLVDDRERGMRLALKTLSRAEPAALYRFKKEFRALSEVSHPNLAVLHELMSVGEQWFLTMQFVDGTDFLTHLCDGRRWTTDSDPTTPLSGPMERAFEAPRSHSRPRVVYRSEADLRAAFSQLACGVRALHRFGKLHRDLKPSNVLVERNGHVVILDFGMVDDPDPGGRLTLDDKLFGTPAYMSPEQAAGEPISAAADWYGVGVMLYEVLTGVLPFEGSVLDMVWRKQNEEPMPPSAVRSGVPPDLDALCLDLLRRRPEDRPGGSEVLERLGVSESGPEGFVSKQHALPGQFVGRRPLLDALWSAYAPTQEGQPVLVLVEGPSGIGKTALVRHFTHELGRREGAVVLSGRCYERESVPFKAIDAVVDSLCSYLGHLPPDEAAALMPRNVNALARLFPVLRRLDVVRQARERVREVPDPQELRRRGLGALKELLGRVSDQGPLALCIDDFQWGDRDSAALLVELLRPPDPANMLVLCCARDGADNPLSHAMEADAAAVEVRRLTVGPLSTEEATELAMSQLHGEDARQVDLVVREAEGSPFFVGELSRAARRAPEQDLGRVSLDRVLAQRMAELPADARRLLELVAIAGSPIPQGIALRAVRGQGDAAVALNTLRAGNFIRTQGAREQDRVECYHDRVRDAVLKELGPAPTRAGHGQLARVLEATRSGDLEALARHFHAAGELERAADYAAQAAHQADEALAFDRAITWYTMALESGKLDAKSRSRLQEGLAEALANAGRSLEAAQAYLAAKRGARPGRALELERLASEQFLRSGHVESGLQTLQGLLAKVHMRLPSTPRRALLSLLAGRGRLRLRGLSFVEREASDVPVDLLTRIDTCWSVSIGLGLVDFIRGADFQTRHLLLALRAGEPQRLARALAIEAGYVAADGAPAAARVRELLALGRRLAERLDDPHALGLLELAQAMGSFHLGHWRETLAGCERAESIFRERCSGVAWEIATTHIFDATARYYLGAWGELARRSPRHLAEAIQRGDHYAASDLQTGVHVTTFLSRDDPAGARAMVEEERKRWSGTGFNVQHWNQLLADCMIDLYEGQGGQALQRVQSSFGALRRDLVMQVQVIRIEAWHLRGQCAVAALGAEPARRRALLHEAERAVRRVRGERRSWAEGLAALTEAAIARFGGKEAACRQALQRAVVSFGDQEMAMHAAAARYRLGQLLGGARGEAMVVEASGAFSAQGVERPERMVRLLAPAV